MLPDLPPQTSNSPPRLNSPKRSKIRTRRGNAFHSTFVNSRYKPGEQVVPLTSSNHTSTKRILLQPLDNQNDYSANKIARRGSGTVLKVPENMNNNNIQSPVFTDDQRKSLVDSNSFMNNS